MTDIERFRAVLARMNEQHGETLRRLADSDSQTDSQSEARLERIEKRLSYLYKFLGLGE